MYRYLFYEVGLMVWLTGGSGSAIWLFYWKRLFGWNKQYRYICYFTLSNNPHYWFIPNLAYSPVTVTRLSATTWLRLLLSPFLINTFIPICCSKSGLWPFDYCYLVCTALYYYPHPVTFSYPLPYSSHNPLYLYVIVVPYRELLLS